MKKSELKKLIKEVKEEILTEEYDTSNINRNHLKSFLNILDSSGIAYSIDGQNETISFDDTELDRKTQLIMKKIGIKENRKYMKKSELKKIIKEVIQEQQVHEYSLTVDTPNHKLLALIKKDKNLILSKNPATSDGYLVRQKNPLIGPLKGMELKVLDLQGDDKIKLARLK